MSFGALFTQDSGHFSVGSNRISCFKDIMMVKRKVKKMDERIVTNWRIVFRQQPIKRVGL